MYTELNVFGVFVAPFSAMLLLAWLATVPMRLVGNRYSLSRWAWHPSLFNLAIYVIVLSLIVIAWGGRQ